MALSLAKNRTKDRAPTDWQRLLRLAGGTLLLVLGLFCAWQTWLIADAGSVVQRVDAARDQAVQALAGEIATQRKAVDQALATVDPATAMNDPAQLAATLRQRLPQVTQLDVYSGDLNEVLHANYRQFGYDRAAQLMVAQSSDGLPLAQSVSYGSGDRRLSLVVPLGSPQAPQAWVWVELPFSLLEQRFEAISPAGGRLELRQGDAGDSVQLLFVGTSAAMSQGVGKSVPGSTFRVRASLPQAFVVLPRSWPLAALLSLLLLGGGIALLWLRMRPARVRGKVHDTSWDDASSDGTVPETGAPAVVQPPPNPSPARAPVAAAAAPVTLDPSIFRAYDIRGVVGKTLNDEVACALGQSIGTLMNERGLREIVVGRDGRLSGPALTDALSEGLRNAGIDVIDIGAVPTPVVYFAAYQYNTGCGVAVTGSHNPPDYNGFKIVIGGETLAEAAIQDLYQRIASDHLDAAGGGNLRTVDVVPDYIEKIVSDVLAERPLNVVVDCGNGIAGALAPAVLEGIGCEVTPLYCDVDGHFPNHHPDPSDPKNLEDLILAVKGLNADLGLAFDGDGDRLGVVTRDGEIIYPDRLLMLFARDVLSRQPGATIIYDVKCSSQLKPQVLDAGGSPLMWRTGHSLIKAKMRETGAELAGEMSGHFFFKERWYGFDDGIYAAARLLEILGSDPHERTPEEIFATLPKAVSTPELKVELAEGEHYRFMDTLRQKANFEGASLVTIDGIRADWPDGWGLVRASNTTPVLVLRFEADDATALKRIQQVFRQQLLSVDATLDLPF